MPAIKILICEDSFEKREYLRQLLNGYDSFELVGECATGEEAIAKTPELQPDVVVMDVGLPGISGIESTRKIKETQPLAHIIMYTVYEDDDKLFDSLCAGASGYLLKKTPPHRLLESILEVMDGGSPMSPGIARKVIKYFHQNIGKNKYNLKDHELAVLRYLVEGLPIKAIAAKVFLSEDGVKKNLKNIYLKLHVNCGKEAVAKAVRERIV
ncbi:MAG: response regulator transcription factor [Saprospiraceae bacterium]|nr:response regulator transcription factor [Saprospiraceae bacterium]